MKIFTLFVLFLSGSLSAAANDSAVVKFIFTTPLNSKVFAITLHDGINEHTIHPDTACWQGELFAPFGYISIAYKNSDTSAIVRNAFFKKGNTKVCLVSLPDEKTYYSIDEKSSVNIVSYDELGGTARDSFLKDKVDTWKNFYFSHRSIFGSNQDTLQKAFALADSIMYKTVEFIGRYPDLYISFWTFMTEVVKTHLVKPDSLMQIYTSVLPAKYKNNKAADHLAGIIQNKIAIVSYRSFPDFSTTDINNRKIELSKLKGKYVLVQIWASWCAPCVAEMPGLKSINDKYKDAAFTLISFSLDSDSSDFRKALEKYSMNWTQVFGDDRLRDALAYYPIPQLYLIDKTGRTIYASTITRDIDLSLLKKMLSERLDN